MALSDEQIDAVTLLQWGEMKGHPLAAHRAYARAIEAEVLKEQSAKMVDLERHLAEVQAELAAIRALEPVAWINEEQTIGPNYGKKRLSFEPFYSCNPLHYKHTPLYAAPPQASQPGRYSVPEFIPIAQRKLNSLMADGYQITGYSIERTRDGTVKRGAVTCGGMVLWWHGDSQTVQASQPLTDEPFGYVNTYTGQFYKGVEPCRKNNEGHWRTVFTSQQPTQPQPVEREPLSAAQKQHIHNETGAGHALICLVESHLLEAHGIKGGQHGADTRSN